MKSIPREQPCHSVISFGNTPDYEPRCRVNGPGCQGRAVGICWDCVLLTCFACGAAHRDNLSNEGGGL